MRKYHEEFHEQFRVDTLPAIDFQTAEWELCTLGFGSDEPVISSSGYRRRDLGNPSFWTAYEEHPQLSLRLKECSLHLPHQGVVCRFYDRKNEEGYVRIPRDLAPLLMWTKGHQEYLGVCGKWQPVYPENRLEPVTKVRVRPLDDSEQSFEVTAVMTNDGWVETSKARQAKAFFSDLKRIGVYKAFKAELAIAGVAALGLAGIFSVYHNKKDDQQAQTPVIGAAQEDSVRIADNSTLIAEKTRRATYSRAPS